MLNVNASLAPGGRKHCFFRSQRSPMTGAVPVLMGLFAISLTLNRTLIWSQNS